MTAKLDRKALMARSLGAERQVVHDRFAAAEAVLDKRPSGIGNVTAGAEGRSFPGETFAAPAPDTQIVSVRIDLISDNPYNARSVYQPEVIKERAASIATHGQMTPAHAVLDRKNPGRFILLDGHYRKKGSIVAGKDEMKILIVDYTDELDLYRLSFMFNEERSEQTAIDNAMAWQKLLDDGLVKTADEIATTLNLSPGAVAKTLAMLRLPQPVLERIRECPEKFGVSMAYELALCAKKLTEMETLQLVERIIEESMSRRQLEAHRAKLEAGVTRKAKETSRQYRLGHAGSKIGVVKEWPSGRMQVDIKVIDPKIRAALVEELKARFGSDEGAAA